MILSISLILCLGMLAGYVCKLARIPALFGMIIVGIVIGPHALNLLDGSILNISAEIRKIALVIILLRAGLKLSVEDLKKVGRPAVLMCFVPATLEVLGMVILAPVILGITRLEAAILGAVIGAVSPAVIVPRMVKLIDEGYGVAKAIPQMILAGASVDDVFVIVLFTTFTSIANGGSVSIRSFVNIPISIAVGIIVGLIVGAILVMVFKLFKVRTVVATLVLLSAALALTVLEDRIGDVVPFASLIGVMSLGMMIMRKNQALSKDLSAKYDKMWVAAEVFLFVLVGASVAVGSLKSAGLDSIVLLACVLVFRMIGVIICTLGTKLIFKERLFCMLAYTPKATVQAAIGGIPLAMGLACGDIVLTVSVIAILLSAPLGAFAIDLTYKKWLVRNGGENEKL